MSPELEQEIKQLASRYPVARGALLPALRLVQKEERSITREAVHRVAELLGLPPSEVVSAVTFYTLLRLPKVGKYLIQVCHTLSCELAGAEEVIEAISQKLHIRSGETTPDGKFTFLEVECLGACDMGPVMLINDQYYPNLTPDRAVEIIEGLG